MKKNKISFIFLCIVFVMNFIFFTGCSNDVDLASSVQVVNIKDTNLLFTLLTPEEYSQEIGEAYNETCGIAYIEDYVGLEEELIIPAYVTDGNKKYKVTEIKSQSLSDSIFTKVIIPNTITKIEKFSFGSNLKVVSFLGDIDCIDVENGAFGNYDNLRVDVSDINSWLRINFNSQNPPNYNPIILYINGKRVDDLIIPKDVTEIKDYAFYNCLNIRSVSFQDGLLQIGDYAFRSTNLHTINFLNEKQSITISHDTFTSCDTSKIERVNLKSFKTLLNIDFSQNPSIGHPDFYIDGELIETLIIPDGTTQINDYTFGKIKSLVRITVPESIVSLSERAFMNCDNLTTVTIKSLYVYEETTNKFGAGRLIQNATTINVLASIVDDANNVNDFLNDNTKYNKSEKHIIEGNEYYTYSKI